MLFPANTLFPYLHLFLAKIIKIYDCVSIFKLCVTSFHPLVVSFYLRSHVFLSHRNPEPDYWTSSVVSTDSLRIAFFSSSYLRTSFREWLSFSVSHAMHFKLRMTPLHDSFSRSAIKVIHMGTLLWHYITSIYQLNKVFLLQHSEFTSLYVLIFHEHGSNY
jgi:hypothetical protein